MNIVIFVSLFVVFFIQSGAADTFTDIAYDLDDDLSGSIPHTMTTPEPTTIPIIFTEPELLCEAIIDYYNTPMSIQCSSSELCPNLNCTLHQISPSKRQNFMGLIWIGLVLLYTLFVTITCAVQHQQLQKLKIEVQHHCTHECYNKSEIAFLDFEFDEYDTKKDETIKVNPQIQRSLRSPDTMHKCVPLSSLQSASLRFDDVPSQTMVPVDIAEQTPDV